MINSIDINLVRRLCDKANFSTKVTDSGSLMTVLSADADYGHDVCVFFSVDGNWLDCTALSVMEVEQGKVADAMVRINRYNTGTRFLTAFLNDGGRIYAERHELIDENVSEEFVAEIIRIFCPLVWDFFKETFKDF